jgi:hypothetical protein
MASTPEECRWATDPHTTQVSRHHTTSYGKSHQNYMFSYENESYIKKKRKGCLLCTIVMIKMFIKIEF